MDILASDDFKKVLDKEIKKFKSYMLDEDYEEFSSYPPERFFALYMYSLVNNSNGLKKVKKKCLINNVSEKEFNKIIYNCIKFIDKTHRGCWSFYEATMLDIPVEQIHTTTLTYTII